MALLFWLANVVEDTREGGRKRTITEGIRRIDVEESTGYFAKSEVI